MWPDVSKSAFKINRAEKQSVGSAKCLQHALHNFLCADDGSLSESHDPRRSVKFHSVVDGLSWLTKTFGSVQIKIEQKPVSCSDDAFSFLNKHNQARAIVWCTLGERKTRNGQHNHFCALRRAEDGNFVLIDSLDGSVTRISQKEVDSQVICFVATARKSPCMTKKRKLPPQEASYRGSGEGTRNAPVFLE